MQFALDGKVRGVSHSEWDHIHPNCALVQCLPHYNAVVGVHKPEPCYKQAVIWWGNWESVSGTHNTAPEMHTEILSKTADCSIKKYSTTESAFCKFGPDESPANACT